MVFSGCALCRSLIKTLKKKIQIENHLKNKIYHGFSAALKGLELVYLITKFAFRVDDTNEKKQHVKKDSAQTKSEFRGYVFPVMETCGAFNPVSTEIHSDYCIASCPLL